MVWWLIVGGGQPPPPIPQPRPVQALVGVKIRSEASGTATPIAVASVPLKIRSAANGSPRAQAGLKIRSRTLISVLASTGVKIRTTANGAGGVWSNGFVEQIELRLRAWPGGSGSLSTFLLPVLVQADALRTTANGGSVDSSSGWDIRFEDANGVKLGHKLLSYTATTGRVVALVNMSRTFTAAQSIFLYAGKSGLGASEESASNARAGGWLAWYSGSDGVDLSGQSRSLTPANLTAATVGEFPGGTYNGTTSVASTASVSWLNGLSALSAVAAWLGDASSTSRDIFSCYATGDVNELNIWAANDTARRLRWVVRVGTSTLALTGPDNSYVPGRVQAACGVWQSGQVPALAVDGALVVPATAPGAGTGTTTVTAALKQGGQVRGTINPWDGDLGFLGFCSQRLPQSAMECMTAALVDPRRLYAYGSPNRVNEANKSPVAQPLDVVATVGTPVDIDVAAAGYDSNPGAALSIVAGSASASSGTVSITGGLLRFTASAAGRVTIDYRLRDPSGKESAGRAFVVASAAVQITAANDAASTSGASPVDINVLANDALAGQTAAVRVRTNSTTAFSSSCAATGHAGTFTVLANGSVRYQPTTAPSATATASCQYEPVAGGPVATITVTVSATATPIAVADSASTTGTAAVDIAVLNNDTLAGQAASVRVRRNSSSAFGTSTATAGHAGTATVQTGGAVRFVADSAPAQAASATFEYEPFAGGPVAPVTVTVNPSQPGNSGIGTPLRTVNVNSADTLRTALTNAQAGDHIVCARGVTYGGTFTLNRAGTQANPIFITEATSGSGRATFTGSIDLVGSWTGIHRLLLSGNPSLDGKAFIRGANVRVTRCTFQNCVVGTKGVVWFNGGTVTGMRIDRNAFFDCEGAIWRGNLTSPTAQGNLTFELNHVDGHSLSGDNEAFITLLLDAFRAYNHIIQDNLFERCVQGAGALGQAEGISIKAGNTIFRRNTITNSGNGYISLRSTKDCLIEGNWLEDGAWLMVLGDDHVIANNRVNDGALIRVEMGNCTFDTATPSSCTSFAQNGKGPVVRTTGGECKGGHPAARRAILRDNIAALRIGNQINTNPARSTQVSGTTVLRNSGTVTLVSGNQTGTTVTAGTPTGVPAIKLTTAMVGPDAP